MAFRYKSETWLTLGEVAEVLGKPPTDIYQVVDAGLLKTHTMKGHRRVSWTNLLDYLEDTETPLTFMVDLVTKLAVTLSTPSVGSPGKS